MYASKRSLTETYQYKYRSNFCFDTIVANLEFFVHFQKWSIQFRPNVKPKDLPNLVLSILVFVRSVVEFAMLGTKTPFFQIQIFSVLDSGRGLNVFHIIFRSSPMKFFKSLNDFSEKKHFQTSKKNHQTSNILISVLHCIITAGTNQLTEVQQKF